MNPTKLIYLEQMQQLECDATVQDIQSNEKTIIYLDQTVFYPQGGGQPFDMGTIQNSQGTFTVDEVRYVEGAVAHKGQFRSGNFAAGGSVHCSVDAARRLLNSRLHTAGHIVDMAVEALNLTWEPTKAYHFPDSPYVEYECTSEIEITDQLKPQIQELCNQYIKQQLPVSCRFASLQDLPTVCKSIPANFASLDPSKSIRVVFIATFGVPCGGTHVKTLQDIKNMTITKIKKKGSTIRVGYDVERNA